MTPEGPKETTRRPMPPAARPYSPPAGGRPAVSGRPPMGAPGPAGQGRPRLNAEAAQRAARAAMNRQYPAGRPYPPEEEFSEDYEEDSFRGLPGSNRFAEEFFAGPPPEDEDKAKKILIRLVIGAAVLLLVLLIAFFVWRHFSQGTDVQLRAVQESTSRKSETSKETTTQTTTETTTEATTTKETETLTPLGTDPYENPPEWAPPTTAPSTGLLQETPAPAVPQAPVVQVGSEASEEIVSDPAFENISESVEFVQTDPVTGLPVEESVVEEVVENPEAGGEELNAPEAAEAQGEASTDQVAVDSQELEHQLLAFPPVPAAADIVPLERAPGKIVTGGTGFSLVMNTGQQLFVEGRYETAIATPDRSKVFAIAEDGRYLLYNADGSEVELPMKAGQVDEGMVGNQAMIYLMDNQLYKLDYATASVSMIRENVDEALYSGDSGAILVSSGGGVYYESADQSIELIAPGSAIGALNLIEITDDGGFVSFEDENNVYLFRPQIDGNTVHALTKMGAGQAQVFRSEPFKEALVAQTGASVIYRVTPEGVIEQVHLPNFSLTDTAYIMPCGRASQSAYESFVLYDNTSIFVVNPTMMTDPANYSYTATYLTNASKEMVIAGNSLYFADNTGQLFVVDVSGEVGSSVQLLSNQGASLLTSTQDGSAIYYLQNGNLMRRRADASSEMILEGVKYFMMTPDAGKIFAVTPGGGLIRIMNGTEERLAEEASGLYEESFSMNTIVNQGGNYWLEDGVIGWLEGANVVYEP